MPLLTKLDTKLKAENASKKTRFLLLIRNPAPHLDGNHKYPEALASYVQVTRKEALRLIDSMLSDHLEAKGARMPVDVDGLNFWFGA